MPASDLTSWRRARWRIGARRALTLGIVLLLGQSVTPARADIYKFVDERGRVHLSDRPKGAGWVLIMRGKRHVRPAPATDYRRNQRRYSPLIDRVSQYFRLDRALIHAIVKAESAYDPNAVSRKGAVGLMQLMPGTAQRYGVRDPYNPAQNVLGGVRHFRDLMLRFNNVALALAAYNAGENAVTKYGNRIPPFTETRNYVRKVLGFYREFRSAT